MRAYWSPLHEVVQRGSEKWKSMHSPRSNFGDIRNKLTLHDRTLGTDVKPRVERVRWEGANALKQDFGPSRKGKFEQLQRHTLQSITHQ